jgi:hypothetical protein
LWLCCAQPQYIPHIFSWLTFFQGSQLFDSCAALKGHASRVNKEHVTADEMIAIVPHTKEAAD